MLKAFPSTNNSSCFLALLSYWRWFSSTCIFCSIPAHYFAISSPLNLSWCSQFSSPVWAKPSLSRYSVSVPTEPNFRPVFSTLFYININRFGGRILLQVLYKLICFLCVQQSTGFFLFGFTTVKIDFVGMESGFKRIFCPRISFMKQLASKCWLQT